MITGIMAYANENAVPIRDDIYWIGGDDRTASIFEGAFPIPEGVSYNSYLIVDGKTCLLDSPATPPSRPSSGGTCAPPWTAGPWTTS